MSDLSDEVSSLIETHLSTGLSCRCGTWKVDTANRPIDPRRQHRDHVADVLADLVARHLAEAAGDALDRSAAIVQAERDAEEARLTTAEHPQPLHEPMLGNWLGGIQVGVNVLRDRAKAERGAL